MSSPDQMPIEPYSVDLHVSDIDLLSTIARERGTSMNRALRGAIATDGELRRIIKSGRELYVTYDGRSFQQLDLAENIQPSLSQRLREIGKGVQRFFRSAAIR
jgi:hypothetical protein